MKNQLFKTPERGNIGIIAAILIVAALFMWQIWSPTIISKSEEAAAGTTTTCRPYNGPEKTIDVTIDGVEKKYKLIKQNALVDNNGYIDEIEKENHVRKIAENFPIDGKDYTLFIVQSVESVEFPTTDGNKVLFDPNGMLVVTQFKKYIFADGVSGLYIVDYYMDAEKQLPAGVEKCIDNPQQAALIKTPPAPEIIGPSITSGAKTVQIQSFNLGGSISMSNWFSFHCKPIIYLYPEQQETVSVKLNPKGSLLETIPTYPQEGWIVTAYPSGKIEYQNKTYPYLYYESKIHDSEVKVPTTGYVRSYSDLQAFFTFILPQMGLNVSEAKEFNDYWVKALPYAPYYFVGFMDSHSIDHIEPLTIAPKPDTIIRVRAYFKALEKPIDVSEPKLFVPSNREGFTVVEWGGMVKTDMSHPFTCSQ